MNHLPRKGRLAIYAIKAQGEKRHESYPGLPPPPPFLLKSVVLVTLCYRPYLPMVIPDAS